MIGFKIIVAVLCAMVLYLWIDNYRLTKDIELLKNSAEKAIEAQARLNKVTGVLIHDIQEKIRKDKNYE